MFKKIFTVLVLITLCVFAIMGCSPTQPKKKVAPPEKVEATNPTTPPEKVVAPQPAPQPKKSIPQPTAVESIVRAEPKEVQMSSNLRRKLNIFFSNFSEVRLKPFERGQVSETELIGFGVRHNVINNPNKIRINGSKGYLSADQVKSSVRKYFGLEIKNPNQGYPLINGSYEIEMADGEAFRFSQISKLVDTGNGFYSAEVNVYEASSGFTGDVHGNLDGWKRQAENPADIPQIMEKIKATIKKVDSQYILVDYQFVQ